MVAKADYYGQKAKDVQQRERAIKAKRGVIYDRNGEILAGNKPVSTISVIHNQIKEPEKVITRLSELLDLDEQEVRKRVEKVSSIERIKANVPKETSDKIREENLAGVMVDEDYKRYYPYDTLASRVIGFTGADNQGIIGLEVSYDDILQGQNGAILTMTTARGLEIDGKAEERREPVAGQNLYTSIDSNLQQFATQAAEKVREAKNAAGVRVIMMNPQNGEIYAMVNSPEFSLTKPYELVDQSKNLSEKQKNEELNKMWRNGCVSDTYEPGSTFKPMTVAACLDEGVTTGSHAYHCDGYQVINGVRIKCVAYSRGGHGTINICQSLMESCNDVLMQLGADLGKRKFLQYVNEFGFGKKTGIDLPGEATGGVFTNDTMHAVELATSSFGQGQTVTMIQMAAAFSSVINGGNYYEPHVVKEVTVQ